MMTEILYEDGDVLVVYKPAGLATQTAKTGQKDVVSELKNYLRRTRKLPPGAGRETEPYLGVVHRLDQPVEGLLVFAKTKNAAAGLSGQLQREDAEGNFCKQYYAVFCGIPAEKEGVMTGWLYKDRGNRAVVTDSAADGQGSAGARKAVLCYKILGSREEYGVALADIRIDTGRFHQIRAQAAHGGMPLLGDKKYGTEETEQKAREMGVVYVALCAYSLEFFHPALKKRMHFQTKPRNRAFAYFSQL